MRNDLSGALAEGAPRARRPTQGGGGATSLARVQALRLLASTPLFRGLMPDDLSELFREVRHHQVPAGTPLDAPAGAGEILYFLKRGRVRLYRMSSSGKKIVLVDLTPPAVFGSMAFVGQEMDGELAEAAEDSLICAVGRGALERLLHRRPDVALRLLDLLGRRLYEVERRVEEMTALTASQRLAVLLLRFANAGMGIVSGFTQDELAEMSGTVRQTVARTLSRWRRAGVVAVRRRSIRILRRETLEALADSR